MIDIIIAAISMGVGTILVVRGVVKGGDILEDVVHGLILIMLSFIFLQGI